jgi:hypothetical protein
MKCQWSRPKKINKIKVSHSSETSPNSFKLILTHRWNHTYLWLHFTYYISFSILPKITIILLIPIILYLLVADYSVNSIS